MLVASEAEFQFLPDCQKVRSLNVGEDDLDQIDDKDNDGIDDNDDDDDDVMNSSVLCVTESTAGGMQLLQRRYVHPSSALFRHSVGSTNSNTDLKYNQPATSSLSKLSFKRKAGS